MSKYTKLTEEELDALDTLIGKLTVEPNFITAIARIFVRAIPVVVRVARVATEITPVVVEGGVAQSRKGYEAGVEAKLLAGEKLTAQDLIEIRKKLVNGE